VEEDLNIKPEEIREDLNLYAKDIRNRLIEDEDLKNKLTKDEKKILDDTTKDALDWLDKKKKMLQGKSCWIKTKK